jgi:hypothetical protein
METEGKKRERDSAIVNSILWIMVFGSLTTMKVLMILFFWNFERIEN